MKKRYTYPQVRATVGEAEWEQRVNLAACYRLLAHYRMTDLIYTHVSARVPGASGEFLINPYGLMFDEITASSLVKVDHAGRVLLDATGIGFNPAGFVIHSCIHHARAGLHCVVHTHTAAGMDVAAQERGLLDISQHAMRFHGALSYHDHKGVALDADEQPRLVADLGEKNKAMLRNHGLLTAGETVREAFDLMWPGADRRPGPVARHCASAAARSRARWLGSSRSRTAASWTTGPR